MVSLTEALNIIKAKARNFGSESIKLEDADGRILSEDIVADRDYPPFNRSAMDGYAIMLDDWDNNIRQFKIQETILAGALPQTELKSGNCYKIMTGASVPLPANCVIRREDAIENDSSVSFNIDNLRLFQNTARQGEDLRLNTIAIKKDTFCSAAAISTLATLGKTSVNVKKLPKTSFFTTGNEVKPIQSQISATQIRNSNEWLVKSMLKKWKLNQITYKHLPDNKTELAENISEALSSDILILSGGVSAGDADYVPEVLQQLGVKKIFHKVEIKPGKPFWFGEMPQGGLVFALPGNPFSTMVTFKLFVETFLEYSLGFNPSPKLSLSFSGSRTRKSSFDEFFPVQMNGFPTQISTIDINGSGDIRLGLYADAIAHHPKENPELSAGIILNCMLLK